MEQCLRSVRKALKSRSVGTAEVFVVDNNSVDGSVGMIKNKFPEIKLIENKKNTGFAFANNQAIKQAQGEYILLLNPDTVVEEDTFEKVLKFMDTHPDGGGLGVYMLDGKGNFLPESKRGLPTPSVAFYKIFGLSKLFPTSKIFGKYHLGYLDKNKINEVEILSGAFMLLRKTALDKVGLLDEQFFMYGEDIDLSYRIIKAGYKNYYFPETKIIHYKGESTKKSSVNYVFVFYKAMVIFAQKHFSNQHAKSFSLLINIAIYLRATAAIFSRFIKSISLPVLDATVIFAGMIYLKNYWASAVKGNETYYHSDLLIVAFSLYISVWLLSLFFSGGYDKPIKLAKIFKGIFIGTGIILIIYSLLSEEYRFSRALILLGAAWASVAIIGSRLLFHFLKINGFDLETEQKKKIVIVAEQEEFKRVSNLLSQSSVKPVFVANVSPTIPLPFGEGSGVGLYLEQLQEIIEIYKIDEVIFCAKDLSAQKIIELMSKVGSEINFKIAPPESLYIIGSNSIDTSGELYTIDINAITKPSNKRSKRLLDVLISLILLVISPINIIPMFRDGWGYFRNIFSVLIGKKSWVGYCKHSTFNIQHSTLPLIKKGVLSPVDAYKNISVSENNIERLNQLYAKDYKVINDLNIILKGYKNLGV